MTSSSSSIARWLAGRLALTLLALVGTVLLSIVLGLTILNSGTTNSGGVQGAMVWPVLAAPSMVCLWSRLPVRTARKWTAWSLGLGLGLAVYWGLRSPRMPLWSYSVEVATIAAVVIAWVWMRRGVGSNESRAAEN